jgi:cellulose synthase/poly-beta-1,6-N-acetylglucosamine synthase-like glycosyltransferase
MKWIFWGATALVAYTYLGYAGWLWLRSRWLAKPVQRGAYEPFISLVMVVRNEAGVLQGKLRNLLELNYPADRYEIVVVSDGSSDGTDEMLREYAHHPRFQVVLSQSTHGKASGLNDAMAYARGEVIVFTDARQKIEADAAKLLVENFADREVGCASGELMMGDPESGETNRGLGLYWGIEKKIREMESQAGSVVGATGALYAVRRGVLTPLPPETILDDVYIPMHVARQGARVVFDSRARAWDVPDLGAGHEFARKVRTLGGSYQLLQLAPWLVTKANPLRFEFVSHKLLRLLAPFALAAVLVTSALLPEPLYRTALATQLVFYGLSLLAVARLKRGPVARAADAAWTFVLLNTAALVAFANFVTGRNAAWSR